MIQGRPRRYQLEWILLGLVLLVFGALIGDWLYAERNRIESLERDRLQVQARVIDENLKRQLEGVNAALAGIRDDVPLWRGTDAWPAASRQLKTLSDAMPGVRTLVILDAAGAVLASDRNELIGRNFSERAYFDIPRRGRDPDVLYVSAPFKTVLDVVVISVTRAILGPKGEFSGVVSATLDRQYFDVLLGSVLYAPDMRAVLVHWDGAAFVSIPSRMVGVDLAKPGSFFSRHRESGQSETLMTGTSIVSGEKRMMASRTFERAGAPMDKRLVIQVSREVSAMYLPWRKQALAYGAFYGSIAAAAIFGLYLLQRRRRTFDRLADLHEKERRDGAERLELALRGADLGLWDWHVSSGRVIFDERWCSMLGYAMDEIEPHVSSWQALVHPDDWPVIHAALDPHLKGETTEYESEHRMRHQDGRWIWILDRGKVMERDAAGAPVRVVGTHMNVTEHKRKEDEYRTIIQASTDGFWITDAAGRILDANESVCQMLGYSREELLRLGIAEIEAGESAEAVAARTREIIETGIARFPGRHRRKDGRVIDVEVSVQYVAALGERFFVFVRDVTERKQAQEALQQSEQRLRAIVETEPECVKVIGRDGQLLEMNAAGLAMLEAESLAEAQRHTLLGFLLPEYRAAFGNLHARVMRGASGMLEFEVVGLKGTRRWLETHAAPMRDAAGEVTMLLGITRDITGRKRAEAERVQLETQLRELQKMEALGTLAGGVAHDFNNIVATIMGNVELACQDVGPGHAAQTSLEEIRKASRRAKDLVQQILAFGRRQVLEREVISLAPVVEESARLLRSTLPAGVSLRLDCAPDAPLVLADATQVQQVLLNLCANAWQAMQGQQRPAAIAVTLESHRAIDVSYKGPERRTGGGRVALRPGRYACLVVRDTGPGMDAATRSRIFEPFFTTKPVGKGTGLGLAVVHGIVQSHGASIAVHSVSGEGATFRIYFPASQASAPAAASPAPHSAPAHGQGKHILYVDDDESIVFLMTRLLERQGYRVSGYTDAREALAAVGAQPDAFNLAVTDYNMPGMSGLELARALREIRADLPVAVASGYITEELRAQAPDAGVRELIYKPNTADELCAVVARLANTLPA